MADKSKSQGANFIANIVKDPRQVPDTLLLNGYLGASSEDKYTRLYFDAQLSSYVEIPDDGILHTQDYPEDSLGRSYVWIKKEAILIHGKAGTKAKFLEGPIVNEYMNAAAIGQGTGTTNNTIFICNETYQDWVCGTTQRGLLCTIVQPPTQDRYCPTQYRPYCPPITPRCPTYSDGPAICPTKVCEVQYQGIGQQQAQPLGFSFPQCPKTAPLICPQPFTQNFCPNTINSPGCNFTVIGAICPTHTPACAYTVSGTVCPTHTPACFPIISGTICFTHTPGCVTQSGFCITQPPRCPVQSAVVCPTMGPCPSIACGFGEMGNPAY